MRLASRASQTTSELVPTAAGAAPGSAYCLLQVVPPGDELAANLFGSEPTAMGLVDVLRRAGGDFGYPSPFGWVRGPGLIQAGYVFDTLLWQDATGSFIPWF